VSPLGDSSGACAFVQDRDVRLLLCRQGPAHCTVLWCEIALQGATRGHARSRGHTRCLNTQLEGGGGARRHTCLQPRWQPAGSWKRSSRSTTHL